MSSPMISVIMGVFNEEKNISSCIESVLNQSYHNFEFIICDDCSSDDTNNLLKKYANKDKRIKIIRNKKNLGLASSLNKCIEFSKGMYIARIDADDICLPNRFNMQINYLRLHPNCALVGGGADVYNGHEIIEKRISKEFPQIKDVLFGPPFIHPSIMIKKDVLIELGGYTVKDYTIRGQDWDLWFKFLSKGYNSYNIQESIIVYHESYDDLNKRTFKTSLDLVKIAINGYRILGLPKYKYIFALKPILSYITPYELKNKIRNRRNYK